MAKLSKTKLLALVSQEVQNSLGFYSSELATQRKEAIKYYLGEPFGNETEGRSSVVSQDLLEVVEAILPSLMRMFTQQDKIVNFDPTQPQDVPYADQISDYCNHIFTKDNNGFNILHSMFKTALLQKNGFCKVYWKTSKGQKKESYKNLTEAEYQALLIDNEVEIIGVDSKEEDMMGMPQTMYDVEVKRVEDYSRVQIDPVPPEEILVSKRATSLEDCDFIAQRVMKTVSELIDMGYDRKLVESLPTSEEQIYNTEAIVRRSYDDETTDLDASMVDPALRVVQITECYMKVDMDGDGIAELRKITVGGSGYNNYVILENEEIPLIPFAMVCAIPMPFRFFGLSFYDLLADLQLVKTTILRNTLDNMYFQNNARTIVVDGQANLDDLLTSRAGGIVRVKNPNAVTPLQTPNFLNDGLAMLGKIEELKEQRSGVPKQNLGLNPDTINKSHTTATSVNQMMQASTQRVELIARNFAEGVKDIFKNILAIVCEYQDQERIIRLRGQFVPMNPREWSTKYEASVQVGLGTGNQDQRLQVLQQVLNVQEKLIQAGGMGTLVTPQNVYNTLQKYLENAGYKDASQFFVNPATVPPQPQQPKQPDPAIKLAGDQIELQRQKAMADMDLKNRKLELDEQRLAAQIIKDQNVETLEKEKLASKIIEQGLN
nr:portal protein [uncultured Mediterranean phage uvMED]